MDTNDKEALAALQRWCESQGMKSFRHGEIRPARGRELVVAGRRYAYHVRLFSQPPALWLFIKRDEHSATCLAGFWDQLDGETWELVRYKILA